MSKLLEVVALVEGPTERNFIEKIVAPALMAKNVLLKPIILSKPGEKGGDVKFARAQRDIGNHLKARPGTWLTLFVDYYGIKSDWPGYDESKKQNNHTKKAKVMNEATHGEVVRLFGKHDAGRRFIPYVTMFEFEALLFSDASVLARRINVGRHDVQAVLDECKEPEQINDSPQTAPSKRLEAFSNRFKKTTTGIAIAEEIGLGRIRARCPLFDEWIAQLENLSKI